MMVVVSEFEGFGGEGRRKLVSGGMRRVKDFVGCRCDDLLIIVTNRFEQQKNTLLAHDSPQKKMTSQDWTP
jgi:hypothetical protein